LATGIAQFIAGGAPAIKDLLPKDTPVQIQQQYQASMLKLEERSTAAHETTARAELIRANVAQQEESALSSERQAQAASQEALAAERKALAEKYNITASEEDMKGLTDLLHAFATIKSPDARTKSLMQAAEDSYAVKFNLQKQTKGWFSNEVSYVAQQGIVPSSVTGPTQGGTAPSESNEQSPAGRSGAPAARVHMPGFDADPAVVADLQGQAFMKDIDSRRPLSAEERYTVSQAKRIKSALSSGVIKSEDLLSAEERQILQQAETLEDRQRVSNLHQILQPGARQ